jgi:hypothetical protein
VERKTSGTTPGGSSTSTGIGNAPTVATSSVSVSNAPSVASNNSNSGVPGALSMTRSPSRDAAAQQQASSMSGSGQLSSRDRSQSIDRAKTPERVRTPHTSREEPVISPQYDSKLKYLIIHLLSYRPI